MGGNRKRIPEVQENQENPEVQGFKSLNLDLKTLLESQFCQG
jgi:hypothetical protein